MKNIKLFAMVGILLGTSFSTLHAESLVIAKEGKTAAKILVDAGAQAESMTKKGKLDVPSVRYGEWKAANDLAEYIEKMSGARPEVVTDPTAIQSALSGNIPVFIVGELALKTQPALKKVLEKTAHPVKVFDADAIVLKRDGNRVFLAGTTDASHYFAVATLLNDWGCRWYMPTEFGEVVPHRAELTIDTLDKAYSPPFEVRDFWPSFNASQEGLYDFKLRNFANGKRVMSQHALGKYTKELIPEGGTHYNIPITDPQTAKHIADKLDEKFANGEAISVGMQDGLYQSDYEGDFETTANLQDKYFLSQDMSDAFWLLYNRIAADLQKRHPQSKAYLGFLAYSNITIPPQRDIPAEPSLIVDLAPIDIDPLHAMTDERFPNRQEYKAMFDRWVEITKGKMTIYDYDQSMLLWRDIPNPSHQVFRHDVKYYRDAGIMGISSESRVAIATTFTNLFFRAQLMWNPDADVDAMLEEFYTNFYGPLAAPMKGYWNAIYKAWEETEVIEHEFFVIPAIYTPELVEKLRGYMEEARTLAANVTDAKIKERWDFTERSFRIMDLYTSMWRAVAEDIDYTKAVKLGQELLKERLALAELNPTFTTRVIGRVKEPEKDAAWLPGEVLYYEDLATLIDGSKGKLVKKLPLEWAFRRDPHDTGLASGFARQPADLNFWNANKANFVTFEQRKDYPTTEWEAVRADLYPQAQGILHPDRQSFTGYLWYKIPLTLTKAEVSGTKHLYFPGLMGEAWLYVNGELTAYRKQNLMWWKNSYRFDWDIDLSGKLKEGENDITIRVNNLHLHQGGMFRRPFIYQPQN